MFVYVFQVNGSVHVGYPAGDSLLVAAKKSVPKNTPFWIVDRSELPDTPQETWELSGDDYDGIGEAE